MNGTAFWVFLCLYIVNYLVGAIPFSLLIGRRYGKDIRQFGSGNVGATNVYRVCGAVPGALAYFADVGKGVVTGAASLLCIQHFELFKPQANEFTWYNLFLLLVFSAPIIGHTFPIYLRFKGGKGVATSAGVLSVLLPLPMVGALSMFFLILSLGRLVSVASIGAAVSLPWLLLLQYRYGDSWGIFNVQTSIQANYPTLLVSLTSVLAMLIVVRHQDNIRRLFQGRERDFRKERD